MDLSLYLLLTTRYSPLATCYSLLTYYQAEMDLSLSALGLCPSAVLFVQEADEDA